MFNAPNASVRCEQGRVIEISADLQPRPNEQIIDAKHHALVPGLHDHHIHLLATAAARQSVDCRNHSESTLMSELQSRQTDGWLRAVNYNETIAGTLDRQKLDNWVVGKPLRVQHTTGQMWFLNSMAIEQLGLNRVTLRNHESIERDASGAATGRLFRGDDLLHSLMPDNQQVPNLRTLSNDLASFGVTGVTDTTYKNSDAEFDLLEKKISSGELLQRVRLMGNRSLTARASRFIATGELKLLLDEANLPDIDELIAVVKQAHAGGRGVAVHCVTKIELAVVINLFSAAGCMGDRIEHASVTPQNTLEQIQQLGLTVVTQPGFIHDRGDQYLRDLNSHETTELYRLQSLIDARIPVALSSDAPYGPLNPWINISCSINRRAASGQTVNHAEGLSEPQALAAYCSPALTPGTTQMITENCPADLAILSAPWRDIRENLADAQADLTLRDGEIIFQR